MPVVTAGWCLAQLGANATLAPFVATISDQVPKSQRASVSAPLGIAQNVGILGGTYVTQGVPGPDGDHVRDAGGAVDRRDAAVRGDPARPAAHGEAAPGGRPRVGHDVLGEPTPAPRLRLRLAVAVLIILATFMVTTFRLFFVQDEPGLSRTTRPHRAPQVPRRRVDVDVLPNPDDSGKDLGVFTMANALPQTVAPLVGAVLLAVSSPGNQNYDLLLYSAGLAALVGALVVLPIRKVS